MLQALFALRIAPWMSGQNSSSSASVVMAPTSGVGEENRHVALRHQHRLAERALGAVAQHEREHERRERIVELLAARSPATPKTIMSHTSNIELCTV